MLSDNPLKELGKALAQTTHLGEINVAAAIAHTLGKASHHELHHRAIKRAARRRHLLHDRVAILTLIEHPRNGTNLTLEAAQTGAQRGDVVFR